MKKFVIESIICILLLTSSEIKANQLQNPGFDDGVYWTQELSPWLMAIGEEPDWSWEFDFKKNGRWAIAISRSDSIGQRVAVTPFTNYIVTLPISGNAPHCVIYFYIGGQEIFSLLTSLEGGYKYYRASFNSGNRDTVLLWFRVWSELDNIFKLDDIILAEADTVRPYIVSAVAYDGEVQSPGIDDDDYIVIAFSEPTNKPRIWIDNIDEVFQIFSGHSWLSYEGKLWSTTWNTCGDSLRIDLYAVTGEPPTVVVGDQFHADLYTITDECGNPVYRGLVPITISGSFFGGPVGPLISGKEPFMQGNDREVFSDEAIITEDYIYEPR
jgi:hypothetical protein